jgi:tetratricopeptide (TPR) repeat protein
MELMRKDEYGLDSSFEKAFIGMCDSEEDIKLIKEYYKPSQDDEDEDSMYYIDLYLELYDKLGMDEEYVSIAKTEGFSSKLIDKLISLGKLEEALVECNKIKKKNSFENIAFLENINSFYDIDSKKLEILKKLGKKEEFKKMLLNMVRTDGDINDALRLKKESTKEEWQIFLKEIISDAKKKDRDSLLSKIYYHENDFKSAYEYSQEIKDLNYLELLAKKLTGAYPLLACEIFKKLCFIWIDSGSGWPYKKAGKMLEAIKKLDKQGKFFNKTKNEIISKHKKKYSLMEVIENV